jgi:hypothetical protein
VKSYAFLPIKQEFIIHLVLDDDKEKEIVNLEELLYASDEIYKEVTEKKSVHIFKVIICLIILSCFKNKE